ncbi:MAG: hypothetical protein NT159_12445 [Proteobacteria bacterium]|nr:hypothetical protein [Pseudomonadota bacterium]
MAIRIRSSFHSRGRSRSAATLASVIAMLAWKLAIDSIKRMREAKFDIDIGRAYFDFVCEHLAFLAHVADRIAYRDLDATQRAEFTRALALRLAEVVEDNADMLISDSPPGSCRQHFLDLFNQAGADYASFDYGDAGPAFGFRRCFASRIREGVPEKDQTWVYDQVMEIEVPEGVKALEKTLAGLFSSADESDAGPRRKPSASLTGD